MIIVCKILLEISKPERIERIKTNVSNLCTLWLMVRMYLCFRDQLKHKEKLFELEPLVVASLLPPFIFFSFLPHPFFPILPIYNEEIPVKAF